MNSRRALAVLALAAFAARAGAPSSRTDEAVRLFDARQFDRARPLLEAALREDPGDARAASYLGRLLLASDELDAAVESLEKSVSLEEGNAEYHLWLGRAYGQKAIRASVLKQPALARKVRKEFERTSQLDPDSLEARFGLIEYYLRAPGVLGGSLEKAREQAREIARRDALQGHRAAGRLAEHEKRFDAALDEYERAGNEFPQSPAPSYWIGSLFEKRKDYERAFAVYERLLETQPTEMTACYQIGRIAILSGQRLERAEQCLKLYLRREPKPDEPSLAWAHYRLGNLYERKGSRDLARREYAEALKLDPVHREARAALKKIS
ncbi:MAG TPA: tetratricopeptide repeat protein [Thermoanaerobaculia bacterium]|nr:tetratricopeptide repeat protein [Thermoanaerobaculia bacterium]